MSNTQLPNLQLPNLEFVSLLGRGGMASVWKARQISLDRFVAVKILSDAFSSRPEDVNQFRSEAELMGRLRHPNIVEVYDANFSDGAFYFVMEFIDGYTMGQLQRRKGMIPVRDVLVIAESVAVALAYAWDKYQIVHRDIKPDNLMVDDDGTLKVTDLGLSQSVTALKNETRDADDFIYGTPPYMSPEQIYGDCPLDCRSDIYSLGATLYHLATGRYLFPGKTDDEMLQCHVGTAQAPSVLTFVPAAGAAFNSLLERMLAKDPDRRYPSWPAVLADIRLALDGKAIMPVAMPPPGSSMSRFLD